MRSVERVRAFLRAQGLDDAVRELDASTRTAPLAAAAVGAPVGAIVKSLLFLVDGAPVLVLTAGDRRVDTAKLAHWRGASRAVIADAETVRRITGYAIGGVPPVAHETPLPVLLDPRLLDFAVVWAAAGSPQAVFPIAPARLQAITGAELADVTRE